MSISTITAPTTTDLTFVDEPLTTAQENTLLEMAATNQKQERTPGSVGTVSVSRAWRATGDVD